MNKKSLFPNGFELDRKQLGNEYQLLLARSASLASLLNMSLSPQVSKLFPGEVRKLKDNIFTLTEKVALVLTRSSTPSQGMLQPENSLSTSSTRKARTSRSRRSKG